MKPLSVALVSVAASGLLCFASVRTAADTPASTPQARYQQALDDLRSAGGVSTMKEIFPDTVQDDQNALPFYNKMLDDQAGQDETDAIAVTKLSATTADFDKAREFLASHAELLNLVHEAATKSDCITVGRADAPDPNAILFPELSQMRRSERIIAIESAVMAHDGHGVDAVKNAALGFELANQSYETPLLIHWLVGVAVDAIAINNIDEVMAIDKDDPAVTTAAGNALQNWRAHDMTAPLAGEATFAVANIAVFRKYPDQAKTALADDGSMPQAMKTALKTPEAWHDFVDTNGIIILNYYKDVFAVAHESYPALSKDMTAIGSKLGHDLTPDNTIAAILLPLFDKCASKEAIIEGRVHLSLACAALLAYKQTHGSYPGDLKQAMTDVPVDPFNLGPIGYRPDGNGFILYCVGDSGTYSGGTSTTSDVVLRMSGDGVMAVLPH